MGEYTLFDFTGAGRRAFDRELDGILSSPHSLALNVPVDSAEVASMTETEYRSFMLGRVSAAGWNAGRRASLFSAAQIIGDAKLNPYETNPERQNWADAFLKGVA